MTLTTEHPETTDIDDFAQADGREDVTTTTPLQVTDASSDGRSATDSAGPERVSAQARSEGSSADQSSEHEGASKGATSLDKSNGITPPTNEKRQARRDLQRFLREHTSLPSVRFCGAGVHRGGDFVDVRAGANPAGFGGVQRCGSPWACPGSCSPKIAARRARDIERVVSDALREGLHVSLLTLTMRHRKGDDLNTLWSALSGA